MDISDRLRSKLIAYLKLPSTYVRLLVPLDENNDIDIFMVTVIAGKKCVDVMVCCNLGKTYFVQIINDHESMMKFPYIYVPDGDLDVVIRHIYDVIVINDNKNLCELHNELCETYNYNYGQSNNVTTPDNILVKYILSNGGESLVIDDVIASKLPFKLSDHMKKKVTETSSYGTIDKYSDDYTRLSYTIIRGTGSWFDKMNNLILGSSTLVVVDNINDCVVKIISMIVDNHVYEDIKPEHVSVHIGQRTYLAVYSGGEYQDEYSIIMPFIDPDDVITTYTEQLQN